MRTDIVIDLYLYSDKVGFSQKKGIVLENIGNFQINRFLYWPISLFLTLCSYSFKEIRHKA